MTNAHRHGSVSGGLIGTSFRQVVCGVLLEVHDTRGEARPELATAARSDESGRGLTIVDAITGACWGVSDQVGPGKVVWALVAGSAPAVSDGAGT